MYNKLKFWMPSAVFFIVLFCSTISVHGQVYKNPDVNRSSTMDTKITAVENTFFYTQVNFTFTSPSSGGGCWLAAPDSKEAMYLQVGTKKYMAADLREQVSARLL